MDTDALIERFLHLKKLAKLIRLLHGRQNTGHTLKINASDASSFESIVEFCNVRSEAKIKRRSSFPERLSLSIVSVTTF